jgi:uncharacterized membrane protein HdeD (DUF308 family)
MSIDQRSDPNFLADTTRPSIQNHWLLFLLEGIALIALGCLAIVIPSITSQLLGPFCSPAGMTY